ncbi:MAG TPA: MurR/RpiR family transcriptional regulator [Trueperaceae bacterium]|nr:MurR/RpiR family transcriptional regulator [Trueperaceae bacterium]
MTETVPQATQSVVLRQLSSVKGSVGPARQKVVDYVVQHAEEVVQLSVTELAGLTGTSEATVVRLFQELKYKGYQDFKIQLSRSLAAGAGTLGTDIAPDDPPEAVLEALFNTSVVTLRDTLKLVDRGALEVAVDMLARARRIEFLGAGGSGAVALDGYHKFIRLGIPVNAITEEHNAAQVCAVLKPGDVVLAISHSGSTRSVLEAVRLAREAGAGIIAITRFGRSPLDRLADVVLHTLSPETAFRSEAIASRIAQLVLLDCLMVSVYLALQPASGSTLERARDALGGKRM